MTLTATVKSNVLEADKKTQKSLEDFVLIECLVDENS